MTTYQVIASLAIVLLSVALFVIRRCREINQNERNAEDSARWAERTAKGKEFHDADHFEGAGL